MSFLAPAYSVSLMMDEEPGSRIRRHDLSLCQYIVNPNLRDDSGLPCGSLILTLPNSLSIDVSLQENHAYNNYSLVPPLIKLRRQHPVIFRIFNNSWQKNNFL